MTGETWKNREPPIQGNVDLLHVSQGLRVGLRGDIDDRIQLNRT